MKKTIVQEFDAPLKIVLSAREGRWLEKDKIPDLKSADEILRREDDKVIFIERESSASSHIPERLRKYVSPEMLKWTEHSTWHKDTNLHEWRVTPANYGGFLDARGKTRYEEIATGNRPRSRRTLEITLNVKVPVLGSIAENMIFVAFKKNFDKDFEAMNERAMNIMRKLSNDLLG
jgi:hypothetical protein